MLEIRAETGDFEYWPRPAVEGMLRWLPQVIFRRFGEIGQPHFGAAFGRIYGDRAHDGAAALEKHGYTCEGTSISCSRR